VRKAGRAHYLQMQKDVKVKREYPANNPTQEEIDLEATRLMVQQEADSKRRWQEMLSSGKEPDLILRDKFAELAMVETIRQYDVVNMSESQIQIFPIGLGKFSYHIANQMMLSRKAPQEREKNDN
jgi:hypothetical protein